MRNVGWQLVEFAARLLERADREAVLGDLVEAGESAWAGLLEVFGLLFRRQAALWYDWRPWLAGLGVAWPSSFLLMGVSLSVSCTYERLTWHKVFDQHMPTGQEGFLLLLCHVFLLISWAWAGGFLVGSVSRRTLWVTAALSVAACLFCMPMFRVESLLRFCLFLFLLPAVWGARQGLRIVRISLAKALVLAITVTFLMILAWSSRALWILNWTLVWPVWYLVATARRSPTKPENAAT